MVVETFTIVPIPSAATYLIYIGPVVLIAAGISRFMSTKSKGALFTLVVLGILVFAGTYLFVEYRVDQPATITVGNGYLQVSSAQTGNVNVTSSQIVKAYVAQIGSGNLSLTREHGLDNGVDKFGVYLMGNGHTAYVVSSVPKDLILKLTSGSYVIVGNSNLTSMVTLFNEEVYPA